MAKATVCAAASFDAKADVGALKKSMKWLGTNEKAIISVLCTKPDNQRQAIAQSYKETKGKNLADALKKEASGKLKSTLTALAIPKADYLAAEIHEAIAGLGTNEEVLIEILCTRTNQEMRNIIEAYERLYKHSIDSDIKGDTSGDFKKYLVAHLKAERDESPTIDEDQIAEDAERLYSAGEGRLGTDESKFIEILTTKSWQHIRAVAVKYESMRGHSLSEAIESEFSGSAKEAMLVTVQCAESMPKYFAKRLHLFMSGAGTKDTDLIRVIVDRCDVDLGDICTEYANEYNKPLKDVVASETSGYFRKALLAMIG